nr:MFS transporter [Streptomyces avermitilis]
MATALGTTPGQATWTATAFGFAYAVGFLLAGPLSDRYGSRAVITAGLVAATAATLAVSAAPNLPTAIALRSLQGLTTATFAPSALSYAVHHIAPQRRGTALTCITSGMLAAAVIMQIGAQAVATGLGWRAVFWLSAALMALSLIPVRRVLRPTLRHGTGGGLLQAFAAMPRLLRRPRLVALYLSTVALMSSFVAVYTAVAIAGPPSIAGNSSAILALRAGALPALVAVPRSPPCSSAWPHPCARSSPSRWPPSLSRSAPSSAVTPCRWPSPCCCSWQPSRQRRPPSSRPSTQARRTHAARPSPSTDAACSSAPAWVRSSPALSPAWASAASCASSPSRSSLASSWPSRPCATSAPNSPPPSPVSRP